MEAKKGEGTGISTSNIQHLPSRRHGSTSNIQVGNEKPNRYSTSRRLLPQERATQAGSGVLDFDL